MPSQMMGAFQEVHVWTSGLDLEQEVSSDVMQHLHAGLKTTVSFEIFIFEIYDN